MPVLGAAAGGLERTVSRSILRRVEIVCTGAGDHKEEEERRLKGNGNNKVEKEKRSRMMKKVSRTRVPYNLNSMDFSVHFRTAQEHRERAQHLFLEH